MKRILAGLLALFLAAPAVAVAQPNLSSLPSNTVVGRLGIGTGPAQAIPFGTLTANVGSAAVNVKNFGAKCDGVTDDSTAIMAADAAAAVVGKPLYFPAGTCMAQGLNPVRSSMEWFGDGPYLSTIKAVSPGVGFDTLLWIGPRSATTQITNVYLHDLGFNGNSTGTNAVVEARNVTFSRFNNLYIAQGGAAGFRSDTSTTTINTLALRNHYVGLELANNTGKGFYLNGEKDSEVAEIFSHNNTSDGFYFGPANLNSSALCETTQLYGGHLSARDNGGDGIVFDEAEKYALSSIQTSINAGYGIRFKSTITGCTSTGSNSVSIGTLVARNDALGAFRVSDGAYMYGAKFGTIWIRGDNSTVSTTAMQLDGVQSTQWGSLEIEGWPGTALLIQSGTPLGVAHDSDHLAFGSVLLRGNGNVGAATNHGINALNATGKVNIGSLISENSQTTGSNYELNVASTVVQFYIQNAILNANAAGTNEINAAAPDIHIAMRRIGTKTLLGGPSTGSNEITANGGAAPVASSCGTGSPTVSGSNIAGLITTGTGTPTSCTVTFAAPGYTNVPYCVVTAQTSAQMTAYVVTNTTITLTTTATNNVKVNYRCDGQIAG